MTQITFCVGAVQARALAEAHRDQRVEMDRLSELYRTVAARRR
jgi:hypothetical protein